MSKQTQNQMPKQNRKFWNFVAAAENQPAELILYGDISTSSWWGDEITPRQFNDDLKALGDASEIVVRINSGGGDVFAANAIYTRLKDHKAKITVKIDGWAGSAATIIAMAGDVIMIPGNAVFMVHDPKMGVLGYYSAEEFVKLAEELKVIKNSIINGYALKTGKDKEEISKIMEESTWYTGEEAVENGFCDELMFEEVETQVENAFKIIVNSVSVDISKLKNIPVSLLNSRTAHNGGGFSNTPQNKNIKEGEDMEIKTVDELKKAYPELTNQITQEAQAAERKRIQDIESVMIDGFETIVNEAKFDKPIAAADVAMKIIAEQKKQGANYIAGRENDVGASGMKGVGAEGHEGGEGKTGKNPFDEAIDKVLPEKK